MTTREERTIQLTLISASDLKKVKAFGKQNSYAVAYIYKNKRHETAIDKNGGLNPSWNSRLTLTADEELIQRGNAHITVEIYSSGAFSDKLIGTAIIPLSDIVRERKGKDGSGANEPEYLAFEVQRPSGKSKGLLNLSISLGEKRTVQVYQNQPPSPIYGQSSGAYPAVPTAYPPQYPPQGYYPPQAPYYPQQGYPPQGYPPPQGYYQQQPQGRFGGLGGGLGGGRLGGGGLGGLGGAGLGLGAGLLGGLLVADLVEDIGDHNNNNNDWGGDNNNNNDWGGDNNNNDWGGGGDFGGGGDGGGFGF